MGADHPLGAFPDRCEVDLRQSPRDGGAATVWEELNVDMLKKAAVAVMVAGGILGAGGIASADSGAQGAAMHSPGVISGNTVQAPIHVPVNACGNTINVIGVLNPTFGNYCQNS